MAIHGCGTAKMSFWRTIAVSFRFCINMRLLDRVCMRLVEPGRTGSRCVCVFEIKVVVPGNIAGLFSALDFLVILLDDDVLDHLPAFRVDGMSDIGVQLGTTVRILRSSSIRQSLAALVAVLCPQMIFHATTGAVSGQLSAWHRDEGTIRSIDDFQIAHDKAIIESNRTKSFQTLTGLFHEFDADFGDFHNDLLALRCAT